MAYFLLVGSVFFALSGEYVPSLQDNNPFIFHGFVAENVMVTFYGSPGILTSSGLHFVDNGLFTATYHCKGNLLLRDKTQHAKT